MPLSLGMIGVGCFYLFATLSRELLSISRRLESTFGVISTHHHRYHDYRHHHHYYYCRYYWLLLSWISFLLFHFSITFAFLSVEGRLCLTALGLKLMINSYRHPYPVQKYCQAVRSIPKASKRRSTMLNSHVLKRFL